jgi:hypothetical protein
MDLIQNFRNKTQVMYEGRTESNKHIYPAMKRRCTYKNYVSKI